MSDAMRDAEVLARAVGRGEARALGDYREERDAAAIGLFEVTDRIAALDWSTDEVKALHHRLSKEMNVGVEMIRGWDDVAAGYPEIPTYPVMSRVSSSTREDSVGARS